MPLYEYICDQCQKALEILQKVDEEAPVSCPECHAKGSLKKAVSHSAFHLKGGGWYKDLYSSSKPAEKSGTAKKKED